MQSLCLLDFLKKNKVVQLQSQKPPLSDYTRYLSHGYNYLTSMLLHEPPRVDEEEHLVRLSCIIDIYRRFVALCLYKSML